VPDTVPPVTGPAPAAAGPVIIGGVAELYLVGTGSAVSDPHRTTTMLALDNGTELLLIDCGGDAVQRMKETGLDVRRLKRMVVTHEHADHCSGFPLLMERLWVEGLRGRFHVHGIAEAVAQVKRIHDAFNTADWPDYPEIVFHEVDNRAGAEVLRTGGWDIRAVPCEHPVPCIGLDVTDTVSGGRLYYSADTEPHAGQLEAARNAPLLVHEATGPLLPGHSSAAQAAELAAAAGAERLVLVHVPADGPERRADLEAAAALFPAVELGSEGGRLTF